MNQFKVEIKKAQFPNLGILTTQYKQKESLQDIQNEYAPFSFETMQHYNPIYSGLFDLTETTHNRVAFKTKYSFLNLEACSEDGVTVPKKIYIKFSPLIDPIKYLTGKYQNVGNLKTLPFLSAETIDGAVIPKLVSHHNSAYIDSFFYYLASQLLAVHNVVHALDFYGSFLGIQDKYKYNMTDNLDYVISSKFFIDKYDKLYTISRISKEDLIELFNIERGIIPAHKKRLELSGDDADDNELLAELGIITIADTVTDTQIQTYEDATDNIIDDMNEITDNSNIIINNGDDSDESTCDSSLNYTTESDDADKGSLKGEHTSVASSSLGSSEYSDDDDSSSNGGDSPQDKIYAYIKQFPVQMICLEECTGSVDDLLQKEELDLKRGSSMLFQIVMTLIIFQHAFHMTHNDLHTDNIMYVATDAPFIYYHYKNKYYKVPTFGKLYKIIDFGRSIYTFNGMLYCSDCFDKEGDAHTQYNFPPFYDENKALIEPNYSFDLCRLGICMYDYLIDEKLEENPTLMNEFEATIYRWCHNEENKNMYYKSNGEERYPGFMLYKMLTRTVHNHIPSEELANFKIFKQYIVPLKSVKMQGAPFINVDKIPKYV